MFDLFVLLYTSFETSIIFFEKLRESEATL